MSSLLRSLVTPIAEQVIDGRSVYLRVPQLRDWPAWSKVRGDSRDFLVPWEPTWPHDALTRSAFRRRLKRYEQDARDGTGYAFYVFRKTDHALLGGVTLSQLRRGVTQSCSLGYWIGESFSRKGYMTAGLAALVDFIFDEVRLNRIEAACVPTNLASKALLLRTGFTLEGYARQYLCINGIWCDHLLFALLASDPRPDGS